MDPVSKATLAIVAVTLAWWFVIVRMRKRHAEAVRQAVARAEAMLNAYTGVGRSRGGLPFSLGYPPRKVRMIAHRRIEKGERVWPSRNNHTHTTDEQTPYATPLIANETALEDEVFLCTEATHLEEW